MDASELDIAEEMLRAIANPSRTKISEIHDESKALEALHAERIMRDEVKQLEDLQNFMKAESVHSVHSRHSRQSSRHSERPQQTASRKSHHKYDADDDDYHHEQQQQQQRHSEEEGGAARHSSSRRRQRRREREEEEEREAAQERKQRREARRMREEEEMDNLYNESMRKSRDAEEMQFVQEQPPLPETIPEQPPSVPPRRRTSLTENERYQQEIQASIDEYTNFKFNNERESEAIEKAELLARMTELDNSGFPPVKRMTIATPLDDLRYEVYRQVRSFNKDQGLKKYRSYLITGASLLEVANTHFNPFELNLNGFSTAIDLNIQDYDSTLLQLHHKYSGRGSSMAPEWSLAMSLTFAAIVHHTSGVATQPRHRRGVDGKQGVKNMASGAAAGGGGMFGSLNPFSLLSTFMRGPAANNTTHVPVPPAATAATGHTAPASGVSRPMTGPPSDTEDD